MLRGESNCHGRCADLVNAECHSLLSAIVGACGLSHRDGAIYAEPWCVENGVLRIDVASHTTSIIPIEGDFGKVVEVESGNAMRVGWVGNEIGCDGAIYCMPWSDVPARVLRIDVRSRTARCLDGESNPIVPGAYCACAAIDGGKTIVALPWDPMNQRVLKIDVLAQTTCAAVATPRHVHARCTHPPCILGVSVRP